MSQADVYLVTLFDSPDLIDVFRFRKIKKWKNIS